MSHVSSESAKIEPPRAPRPVAVIDIGTTSIRMAIAEINDAGNVRILESLSQAVSLGKDTFTEGAIRRATIEDCVRVLKSYHKSLQEYQIVRPDQIRVVATSAVREASNRLAFLDRIFIATGLQVEPIEEAEVTRITYLGIQQLLKTEPNLAEGTALVIEVGGGSTELLLVKRGNVAFSHTYRLGSLRMRQILEAFKAPEVREREIMERHIDKMIGEIREQVAAEEDLQLIALGGDVRFAASKLIDDWNPNTLVGRLPAAALEQFTAKMLKMSSDQIVRRHHLAFQDAETLAPALLTYSRLARAYGVGNVLIINTNLRDGLLREMAVREWTDELSGQILRSAMDLARRFDVDEPHARHVASVCRMLFQQLRAEHQLPQRFEVILCTAALLYQVGLYISNRSHHKHAMYIIRNSEIFGLSTHDVLLVSLVARYHRRASPQPDHEGYSTLNRDDRVAVVKMAAMLRVAVALDDSRSQRIQEIQCSRERGRFVITISNAEDVSLEQLALRQSGSIFEETFGVPAMLRTLAST